MNGPTRQIKVDIYLWHQLRNTLEDTRRRSKEAIPHWTEGVGGRPVVPGHRLWGPPVSLHLLTSVLHRLRVLIYVVVLSQFDLRTLVHSMGLCKQSLHPLEREKEEGRSLKFDQVIRVSNPNILRAPPSIA